MSQALKKINYFRSQSENNYVFACQAAIPLVLTPDLLYQLWNNFKVYHYVNEPLESFKIPSIAISNFLLSDLCREVGFEIFEMEKEIRDLLSTDLVFMLGEKRKNTIAKFLEEYAENEYRLGHRQGLRDLHQLTALSILSPSKMEEKIIEKINNTKSDSEKIRHLLLHNNLMPQGIKSTLKEISTSISGISNYNNLSPILIETQNENDINVLKVALPSVFKDKVRQVKQERNGSLGKSRDARVADDIIREVKEKRLTQLDLGYCGLTEIPDLSDMDWLETLILSNEWWDSEQKKWVSSQNKGGPNHLSAPHANYFPRGLKTLLLGGSIVESWDIKDGSFLGSLTNLQTLDLRSNQISDGSFLEKLTNLQTLYLGSNQIKDGSFLGSLTNLQTLDLSFNQISDGSSLGNLTNLQTLDFRYNQISNWSFLGNLTNLQTLDLRLNKISDGSFLGNLMNLQTLHLSSNQIIDGSFLGNLTNLQTLHLSLNQISDWSFLGNLTNLQTLDLSSNQISDGSFLAKLANLQTLVLRYNQIGDGSFLAKLANLQTLDLSYNQISDGSFLGNLTGLIGINLSNNQLTDLSPLKYFFQEKGMQIVRKEWYETRPREINVKDNPLVNPPVEIVQQGHEAILEYFRQKAKTGAAPLLEAKLILLGEGRAGKTSLANRLLGKPLPKEQDRTQGIDIVIGEYDFEVAEGRRFKLHIWDFAGQDKYKPLHQFFYTEGAVYVMVADSGNAGTDYDDWLQTAQLFGAGSPLLMALNEFRTGMGYGVFDEEHWKKRFPSLLKEVHLVNLLTQDGVAALEKDIQLFAQRLPHTTQEYPKNWAAIRQELERRREENFITWAEYLRICRDNDLPERESALILSGILHKIGVCLHYHQSPLLKQHVILKNEWATDAVYRVLEDRVVAEEKKGFFDWDDLHRIWSDEAYQDMCPQLLELMQYFELAYPLPNQREYVTPQLLPPAPPPGWEMPVGESLQLLIEYEFLPKALMTQFIVQRHTDIDRGRTLVWRNGVVLRWPDALAEVVKTKSRGRDAFGVQVQGANRKGLLTSILRTFRELHAEYKGIRVAEIVPCPCTGCRTGKNKPHFFDLENLKSRLEKGRRVVECDKSLEEVPLLRLLDNLFLFEHLSAGQPLVLKEVKVGSNVGMIQSHPDTKPPRDIKIFLASSAELSAERKEIEIEINRINKDLRRQNTYLELLIWEDGQHISQSFRSQDNNNRDVESCDIFALLFYSKVGKFTKEEFGIAKKRYDSDQSPKILIFQKDIALPQNQSREEAISRLDFIDELTNADHFPILFKNVEGLLKEFGEAIKHLLKP